MLVPEAEEEDGVTVSVSVVVEDEEAVVVEPVFDVVSEVEDEEYVTVTVFKV